MFDDIEVKINIKEYTPALFKQMIYNTIISRWDELGFDADVDMATVADYVSNLWFSKYIGTGLLPDLIRTIKRCDIPEGIELLLRLTIAENGYIILTEEDIGEPVIEITLLGEEAGSYIYRKETKKMEWFDELINPFSLPHLFYGEELNEAERLLPKLYELNNCLLGKAKNYIYVVTSQPRNRIERWYEQGYIPAGTYFANEPIVAYRYFERGDVIKTFSIPVTALLETYNDGKFIEYVTTEDVPFSEVDKQF